MTPEIPPHNSSEGYNLFLSWGMIEWALTAIVSGGMFVAGWVWRLAIQVDELRLERDIMEKDIQVMRRTIREIGSQLDRKIEMEMTKVDVRMARVEDKMDEMRENLPSRAFIEGQLTGLSQRIDRSMDVKLAGR